MGFERATREHLRLRMALCGVTGAGKSFTALRLAHAIGDRIAVICTENRSAEKYADVKNPDGGRFKFDVHNMTSYHPDNYVKEILAAEAAGYDVLIIDGLSHAWMGKDGALDQKDKATVREKGNSYTAWRHVTPMHNRLIDTMLASNLHLIVTMRSKMAYIMEENSRGKQAPIKVGLAPVQREGVEYEFDIVGDIDHRHQLAITKSRCPEVSDAVIDKPGAELASVIMDWLGSGEEPAPTGTEIRDVMRQLRREKGMTVAQIGDILKGFGVTEVDQLDRGGRIFVMAALMDEFDDGTEATSAPNEE